MAPVKNEASVAVLLLHSLLDRTNDCRQGDFTAHCPRGFGFGIFLTSFHCAHRLIRNASSKQVRAFLTCVDGSFWFSTARGLGALVPLQRATGQAPTIEHWYAELVCKPNRLREFAGTGGTCEDDDVNRLREFAGTGDL